MMFRFNKSNLLKSKLCKIKGSAIIRTEFLEAKENDPGDGLSQEKRSRNYFGPSSNCLRLQNPVILSASLSRCKGALIGTNAVMENQDGYYSNEIFRRIIISVNFYNSSLFLTF